MRCPSLMRRPYRRLPGRLVPRQAVRLPSSLPTLASDIRHYYSARDPGFVGAALSFVECRKPGGVTPAVVFNAAYKPELGPSQPATLCAGSALGSESNQVFAVDVIYTNSNCSGFPDGASHPTALDGSCVRCLGNCSKPFLKSYLPCKAGAVPKVRLLRDVEWGWTYVLAGVCMLGQCLSDVRASGVVRGTAGHVRQRARQRLPGAAAVIVF